MATKKKGVLTPAGCWNKHMKPYGKRTFWKKERLAAKGEIRSESKSHG